MWKNYLFVSDLNPDVDVDIAYELFSQVGTVDDIWKDDRENLLIVEFDSEEDVLSAILLLSNTKLYGERLKLSTINDDNPYVIYKRYLELIKNMKLTPKMIGCSDDLTKSEVHKLIGYSDRRKSAKLDYDSGDSVEELPYNSRHSRNHRAYDDRRIVTDTNFSYGTHHAVIPTHDLNSRYYPNDPHFKQSIKHRSYLPDLRDEYDEHRSHGSRHSVSSYYSPNLSYGSHGSSYYSQNLAGRQKYDSYDYNYKRNNTATEYYQSKEHYDHYYNNPYPEIKGHNRKEYSHHDKHGSKRFRYN